MLSSAFAGFLRFKELVNIRFADLTFFDSRVQIFIPKSKTDILGKGINCLLQEQAKKHVLLFVLKIILEFPRLRTRKNFYLEHYSIKKGKHLLSICNKPISYSRVRELFRTSLDKIDLDKTKYGLHSLESGGATSAAYNSVADRLFKTHGRCRSEHAKDGYVQDDVKTKLCFFKFRNLV